jgi:hypothetical protein
VSLKTWFKEKTMATKKSEKAESETAKVLIPPPPPELEAIVTLENEKQRLTARVAALETVIAEALRTGAINYTKFSNALNAK